MYLKLNTVGTSTLVPTSTYSFKLNMLWNYCCDTSSDSRSAWLRSRTIMTQFRLRSHLFYRGSGSKLYNLTHHHKCFLLNDVPN